MQPEILQFLADAAQAAPSADNSQPWTFAWDGESFTLSITENKPNNHSLKRGHPAVILALGCACENIIQALQSIGISNIRPEINAKHLSIGFRLDNGILSNTIVHSDDNLALFQRHTNRFPFKKNSLPEKIREQLSLLQEKEAKVHLYETDEAFSYWAQQIRAASEVRFQSQDIHEWLGDSLRFSKAEVLSNNGLDVKTLDLPPGGKQILAFTTKWSRMAFLNKFGLYKFFAFIESLQLKQAAALVCISSPLTTEGIIDAGRLMERLWIDLNSQNLAVHPYFVLSDQIYRHYNELVPEHLKADVNSLTKNIEARSFGKMNHLQIVLRIGEPTVDPVRSRRQTPTIDTAP